MHALIPLFLLLHAAPADPTEATNAAEFAVAATEAALPFSTLPHLAPVAASAISSDAMLAPIEVVGRRGFDPRTGSGSSVDVPETRARISDAGELLAHEVGVTVRRSGSPGSFQSISIRGTAANQTQIFLNGVPLPSSIGGALNPGLFPLDALERIDVYRGSTPPRFARSTLGGAIDIVTLEPARAPAGLRLAAGSFDTLESSAFIPLDAGPAGLLLGAGLARAEGDFAYLDNRGTLFNLEDDIERRRENNASRGGNGFLLLDLPTERQTLRGHMLVTGQNQGLAGFAAQPMAEVNMDTRMYAGGLESIVPVGNGELRAALFGGALREHLDDPRGELLFVPSDQMNRTDQGGLRLGTAWRFGAFEHEAVVEMEELHFTALAQDVETQAFRQRRGAVALGTHWTYHRWSLLASVQGELSQLWEAGSTDTRTNELTAARVGGGYRILESLTLLGNAGTGYRQPTAQEQFGNRGSQVGNSGLEPEVGWFTDGGFQWRTHQDDWAWSLDVRYFRQEIENLIAVYQSTPKVARAHNFASVLAAGYEADFRLGWRQLKLGLNSAHQAIINTGPVLAYHGKQLPGRPRWQIGGDVAWTTKRWVPFYLLDAQGDVFLDPVNTAARHIPLRFYHDAGLTYLPLSWIRLTGSVRNIGDVRSQDFLGFPLPGRSYGLVLQFTTQ